MRDSSKTNKDIYILDKLAIIETYGNDGDKKTLAHAIKNLSSKLFYDEDTLRAYLKNKSNIIRPELAKSLNDNGMSEYYLSMRSLLYQMSCTGTTLFKTNEKIALSTMLFDYTEKQEWTVDEICQNAGAYIDCKKDKIETALSNKDFFLFNEASQTYSLNIHGLCEKVN